MRIRQLLNASQLTGAIEETGGYRQIYSQAEYKQGGEWVQ